MNKVALNAQETGLEVIDLYDDPEFAKRRLRVHNPVSQMEGMRHLAEAFVDRPETVLQELVNSAIVMCEADSAGISIQKTDENGEIYYHWVATAGKYGSFLNAMLPPFPSACGVCIERGRPQIFRVTEHFLEIMKIEADTVTDGLLIPWEDGETHGTIWVMAHGRHEAFDGEDCRLMQALANFAALGSRQKRQQQIQMEHATATAAAEIANTLAHSINNPLQSLTNLVYLTSEARNGSEARVLAEEMSVNLERLAELVRQILSLKGAAGAQSPPDANPA